MPRRSRSSLSAQLPPAVQRARNLRNSEFSLNPVPKRKRSIWDEEYEEEDDSDNSPDAQIARALQNEENSRIGGMAGDSPEEFTPRRTRRMLRPILPKVDYSMNISDVELDTKPSSGQKINGSIGESSKINARRLKKTKTKRNIPDSEESEFVASDDDDMSEGIKLPEVAVSRGADAKLDDSCVQVVTKPSANFKGLGPVSQDHKRSLGTPRRRSRRTGFYSIPATKEESEQPKSPTQETLATPTSINDGEDIENEWSGSNSSDGEDRPIVVGRRALYEARRRIRETLEERQERKVERRARLDRARLEAHHPELLTMWKDLENLPQIKTTRAEQPENISRQLKPFQLEGLSWMQAMEKMEWGGGLLGDEMGMGKTIQAVSLIMSDYPAKNPSLVLIPPVALIQWQQEIGDYTDGTLKTFVFHGTNKNTKDISVRELTKYDVILMSYNSLESMYRHQEKGFRRKEEVHFQKSVIHSLHFHRVILDEAHNIKV